MKVLLIDGNSILNRSFYGVRLLTNREGLYTNAVYGFLSTFFKLCQEEKPDGICVCFDMKDKTFRHSAFEGYKAKRAVMPDELQMQVPVLKEALDLMGIYRLELSSYEADDLIGTISRIVSESGEECVIVTGDRDTLQLIGGKTSVKYVTSRMGKPVTVDFDEECFRKEYAGLEPSKIIDLKALAGDASDNIPGVRGIGEKTALDLITRYSSLDNLYSNLSSEDIKESVRNKLTEGRESAYLSYALATIDKNAPVGVKTEDLRPKKRDDKRLYELFMKLEFKNFITKLELKPEEEPKVPEEEASLSTKRITDSKELYEFLEKAKSERMVYLAAPRSLCATAVLCADTVFLLYEGDFEKEDWSFFINEFYSAKVCKAAHDAKPLMKHLLGINSSFGGFKFDTALGAYLLSPADLSYAIEKCALSYLGREIKPDACYQAENAFIAPQLFEDAFSALSEHAAAVRRLYNKISPKIAELDMERLYFEIELPLASVLASMQHEGFQIDKDNLKKFGESLDREIEDLTGRIYLLGGGEFNINSTKALGDILFNKLSLPYGKKNKTGYSTDIDVLGRLKGKHPIIEPVIEYRKYAKLKSTYVEGLLKVICPRDGRIHSTFNQTVTVTGRLSSTEPNLQNIPVRQEIGSEIRHMFTAKEGFCLLDADYSQIELRVLAHIAHDERMIEAFLSGGDIHKATASQVFSVSPEEVTSSMRRAAKAVNFGIVYGISAFSLAEDIGVSVAEAARYIESYLNHYAGVKRYMDEIRKKAKEDGFVTTLLGRRRSLPELKSSNFNIRSFGERVALNTPIQGTAADIIKIAMINVHKRLKEDKLRSRLILQVHDELIIETAEEEIETVSKILKDEMEGAFSLDSELVAEVSVGKTWFDAKK